MFDVLDVNKDGSITHAELIRGLKGNEWVAEKLGMPAHIRQEDGTRENYQSVSPNLYHSHLML